LAALAIGILLVWQRETVGNVASGLIAMFRSQPATFRCSSRTATLSMS